MPRQIPDDRFQELIQASTQLFLEQGYRRTQMSDVADRLGVAKGTIYLYVESKEALLDSVLRHADAVARIALPETLPLATPPPGATLKMVRERVARAAALPELGVALERRRVTNVAAELEAIIRELYALLARHRVGIKLLDRCAQDYPDLAAVWYETGRRGALELLRGYLQDRIDRRRLRPVRDAAVTARVVLEIVVFWAVHRHWDPAPQTVDEATAEQTVVEFVLRALLAGTTQ